jgi:hypothetical protein
LVGEFDDIRVTDKQLELAEIAAFGQTHTVDEVRAKYYGDVPLGDDRGNLLVTEVGKGLTPADPDPEPPPMLMPPNAQQAQAEPDDDEADDDAQDMPHMAQEDSADGEGQGQEGQGPACLSEGLARTG